MDQVTAGASLCLCSCPFCCSSSSTWRRCVKRKLDPEAPAAWPLSDVARVVVEDEVAALREAVASQLETMQELSAELEEERNAAASAATEAMSMIHRLQREKAEVTMEARQFKRFAEEKMAHDQAEIFALEDLLFKRDEAVQFLSYQLQAYHHRLESCGVAPPDIDALQFEEPGSPSFNYPPLKCEEDDTHGGASDRDKHPFEETPHAPEYLRDLEQRIIQLENDSPRSGAVMEKGVVDNQHELKDVEDFPIAADREMSGSGAGSSEEGEDLPVMVDGHVSDAIGDCDDSSDRVYVIDSVYKESEVGVVEECSGSPMEKKVVEPDIKKLYMRLDALEADRESMRQAIVSMRTEKAQLALLKEIAQQLCKEVVPEKRTVKKSFVEKLPIIAAFKWVLSFIFWRKKVSRSRYTFGLSNNNVGLLLILDKSPQVGQWRCLSRTRRTTVSHCPCS
ncbi:myosin-binding protein 7-like [Typha angustifolia]|uniref:myosin-binding protein 7-like n=1 Tax=Typha angustifolia TaxID=59011 RepID=UPI003C2F786C